MTQEQIQQSGIAYVETLLAQLKAGTLKVVDWNASRPVERVEGGSDGTGEWTINKPGRESYLSMRFVHPEGQEVTFSPPIS
jgi:hypothetical protein